VDASADFVRLARANAPKSKFVAADLWSFRLPQCDAVTAIGEVLNYGRRRSIAGLFRRVFRALRPGGVFVFDLAGLDRIPKAPVRSPAAGQKAWPHKIWSAGEDWAVLAESAGSGDRLRRSIISFRKEGRNYRRR